MIFMYSRFIYMQGAEFCCTASRAATYFRVANKFCAYVDYPHDRVALSVASSPAVSRSASASEPEFVVSLPSLSEHILRTPQMARLLMSRMEGLMLPEAPLCSPGAIGEELENSFDASMEFNWTLSAISGTTARLAALLSSSRVFSKLDICFDIRQVRYSMGKVLRTKPGAERSGKSSRRLLQ